MPPDGVRPVVTFSGDEVTTANHPSSRPECFCCRVLLEPFGLSLLHFLWQGGLVGLGLWLLLRGVGKANHRYAAACSSLVLLVALPVVTYLYLQPGSTLQVSRPLVTEKVAPAPAQTDSIVPPLQTSFISV